MKEVFGSNNNMIRLEATEQPAITKKDKKANVVKIYLSVIEPLDDVKNSLAEISETIQDPEVKKQFQQFSTNVATMAEQILDFTKVAIRGVVTDSNQAEVAKPEANKFDPATFTQNLTKDTSK